MGDAMTCLIWCDECCGENWDGVSTKIHEGLATSKSGRLKVMTECRGCGVLMLEGESAEAVTLHGGSKYPTWEGEYIETGWEEMAANDERVGRVQ